ncbi:UDP-N-acetylmuramoylalanyl-D-glutamate--2,6-diaminopimelate ligase [Liberibacter crescens]|nr:UDP-N-acetylmuramoylalanyl-D-glutamate--2,6-diaminopimelate ligase [Liberibacter crescens]
MDLQELMILDFPELIPQFLDQSIQEKKIDVLGISSNSQSVRSGWVFVAISGAKINGSMFIAEALQRGAIAIVISSAISLDSEIISILKKQKVPFFSVVNPRRFLSLAASRIYKKQPKVIVAVTGTSGKTSVTSFVRQIWQYGGYSSAQIGTIGIISNNACYQSSLTTPDPVYLAQKMEEFVSEGITHVAIEASSHGLDQHRLDGLHLFAGAFTNLGRDHMDYHATVDDYFLSKMRLFKELLPKGAPAIIWSDDSWSEKVIDIAQKSDCRVRTVGQKGTFIHLEKNDSSKDTPEVLLRIDGEVFKINFPLLGTFQLNNALVAAGLCIATDMEIPLVVNALQSLQSAPGRLEFIGQSRLGGKIYIDYAHNPESLEIILKTVRAFTIGRVVVVFGCGGDRDKGKRPLMGKIALELADVVIVTDDNPRSENPSRIRAEIIGSLDMIEIGDRKEAICAAINMLKKNDTLIIAGKGHEEVQIMDQQKIIRFSDREEIRQFLKNDS